jgi:poly(3-hydroxybutyrate) depolymerase
MRKIFVTLGLAAVMAVAGTLAFDVLRGPDNSAALAAKGTKVCKAKTNAGKMKTWRCGADQACCVNRTTDQYVCGIPGLGCI